MEAEKHLIRLSNNRHRTHKHKRRLKFRSNLRRNHV